MADPFREPVRIRDPDPAWAGQYAAEARRLAPLLTAFGATVEHIGSTSVPLRGKPIIDVQVVVDDPDVDAAVAALERFGYDDHGTGGVPGRRYLTRRPPHGPSVNVHVFGASSPLPADNRLIRDYLRAHADAAAEYARVKERALAEGHADLLSYSDAKRDQVAAIRAAARRWASA